MLWKDPPSLPHLPYAHVECVGGGRMRVETGEGVRGVSEKREEEEGEERGGGKVGRWERREGERRKRREEGRINIKEMWVVQNN